jgi:ABC-type Fe3+ transport system substrate-binding protein
MKEGFLNNGAFTVQMQQGGKVVVVWPKEALTGKSVWPSPSSAIKHDFY